MTEADWRRLADEVYGLFSPGAPIRIESELAGRVEQSDRLRRIALTTGEHALIYGERGVGKTSIANSFFGALNTPTSNVLPVLVNCGKSNYTTIWRKVFRRLLTVDGDLVLNHYPNEITPDDVEIEISNFSQNSKVILVLDEFDQIQDADTRQQFTETIKSLSDHSVPATIVLVGIAENASSIIADHRSISRALKQVEMPRLSLAELEKIVTSRYNQAEIKVVDSALFLIAFLSRGLPYYAHLCGRYSALAALRRKRKLVEVNDVISGLEAALAEVDQSITESYINSTVSQRGDETLFEPVLLACALADSDQLGQFQQSAVTKPLSFLVERSPPYSPTTFAFHMNEFCEEKRCEILQKSGPPRNIRYRFSDALMQPYVILRALRDRRLAMDTLLNFIPRRQLDLGID